MSTYLKLCQNVALESGTVPGTSQPTSVTGQIGRLARIVKWVNDAWGDIQRRHDWRWMEAEFSGTLNAGQETATAADMGISDRFGSWIYRNEGEHSFFSIYKVSEGVSDERPLVYKDWDYFRRTARTGDYADADNQDYPVWITVAPDQSLMTYAIPDTSYQVRGRYRQAPQTLSANTDEPEMPAKFHRLIELGALLKLENFDESQARVQFWLMEQRKMMSDLETSQIGPMIMAEPLY